MEELDKPLVEKIKIFREIKTIDEDFPYIKKPKFVKKPEKIIKYDYENFSVLAKDEPSYYWYWLLLLPLFLYFMVIIEFVFSVPEISYTKKIVIFFLIILSIKIHSYIVIYSEHIQKKKSINENQEKYNHCLSQYQNYEINLKNYEKEEEIQNELSDTVNTLKKEIINDFIEIIQKEKGLGPLNGELSKKYQIHDIISFHLKIKSRKKRAETRSRIREEEFLEKNSINAKKSKINDLQLFYRKEISQILKRNDLNEQEKIDKIINIYSWICATVAIQPIPFADIFILSPIQLIMGEKIGKVRGYNLLENNFEIIFKEVSGALGLGIIAQQLAIGGYKTIIPFYGAITTIPMVYGLTYGIGKVIDYYILAKVTNKIPDKDEMKRIYKNSKKEGEKIGKTKENEIKRKP